MNEKKENTPTYLIMKTHLCIRNDSHCPICRMWYVTIVKEEERFEESFSWVDEWVRRRNGDKYEELYIKEDYEYNLQDWSLSKYGDSKTNRINSKTKNLYLLLKILNFKFHINV